MQYTDMKEIEQRPKKYWHADGVTDIVMGAAFFLWGAALGLPKWLHWGNWSSFIWIVVVLLTFAANPAVKKLKERFTFPRTGYVELMPQSGIKRMTYTFLGGVMAVAFVLLIHAAKAQSFIDLLPAACALLYALTFLGAALWHKLPHYLWASALSLALAFIILRYRVDLSTSFILLLLSLGACIFLMGGIRLYAYLRRNPRQREEEA